uniref:Uncharacterized protein n=1 Tax=Anguilla anguilla TaxID=7936 RepID=A0A0E9TP93_ANGAN
MDKENISCHKSAQTKNLRIICRILKF